MITHVIRKQFSSATAIGKLIPGEFCDIGTHRNTPHGGTQLHKRIPARMPRVTHVLCHWEINSQIIKGA